MPCKVISISEIHSIVEILHKGGIVALPTDTLYALSCNAYDTLATSKIMELKKRDTNKTLPVLLGSIAMAQEIATVNASALGLMSKYWPGALTIVIPCQNHKLSKYCISSDGYVALRMPAQSDVLNIINQLGAPIVGTSANLSSEPVLTSAQNILKIFGGSIDAVYDTTSPLDNLPSTIVKITDNGLEILRQGAVHL